MRKTIVNRHDALTRSQQRLAQYVLSNYEKCAFMTAAEIGQEVRVSESTVIRFANALGFSGFPELRNYLQDILKSRVDTVYRTAIGETNASQLPYRAMRTDAENIIIAQKSNSYRTLQEAVESMLAAHRIALIGFRSAKPALYYAEYNLGLILPEKEILMIEHDTLYEQISRLDERDVTLAVSLNRYPKKTIEGFHLASKQGCTCIALTDSVLSPLSSLADILIIAPGSLIGFVDSFVTPLSILRSLLLMLVSANTDSQETLKRLEKMWKDLGLYQTQE